METLIFWAFPAAAVLLGLKSKLMVGWQCFVSGMSAVYLGIWIAPLWYGLLDFLPSEAEPYRLGASMLFSAAVVFILMFSAAQFIIDGNNGFDFPPIMEKIVTAVCCAGFGIALGTLLFTVCCTMPVRTLIRNNGDGFERWSTPAVLNISAVGDLLTFCTPREPRAEALAKMWYKPPAPAAEEPPQPTAPATADNQQAISSSPASPAENQAAAQPAPEVTAEPPPPRRPASFAGGRIRRKPQSRHESGSPESAPVPAEPSPAAPAEEAGAPAPAVAP
jgi:hypothetical protein